MTTYRETVDWLYGLQTRGMKFGLDNMRTLCRLMGDPQNRFKSVHLAGTNGKGSCAAFITKMAESAGLRCGLTVSPHLVDLTERIRINDTPIARERLIELTTRIRDAVERHNADHADAPLSPTYFEFTMLLAFCHFAEENVDLAVVEAGLGGRLDSTNVLKPILTLITSIGMEHTQYLGDTLGAIAREKAGIIKPDTPLLTAVHDEEALEAIEAVAEEKLAPLLLFGCDFTAYLGKGRLSYFDAHHRLDDMPIGLKGAHQRANAGMAIAAAYQLQRLGFPIDDDAIRRGIAETRWPGRLELFAHRPPWLVDCAHNPAAVETLAVYLMAEHPQARILAVFAAMKDKNYAAMLARLAPQVDTWIFTRPAIDRAENPEALQRVCHIQERIHLRPAVADALKLAEEMENDFDLVLVAGSIFLVGEAYPWIATHTGKTGVAGNPVIG